MRISTAGMTLVLLAGGAGRLIAEAPAEAVPPPPALATPAPADAAPAAAPVPAVPVSPSPEQIKGWIGDLADERFEKREAASRQLEAAGVAAVGPLVAATATDNLETIGRAVCALGVVARSCNDAGFDVAQTALENLAESKNRAAAWRADLALQSIAERRRARALARVVELGAIVKRDPGHAQLRRIGPFDPGRETMQVVISFRWKGGDAGLMHLYRLADADRVMVSDTVRLSTLYYTRGANLSQDALAELRRRAPDLPIETRGDAMLGIKAAPAVSPLLVSEVVEGSAADKAGVRPEDVILKYDGRPIANFDDLKSITELRAVGDKVSLEVLRDNKVVHLFAELAEWK